MDFIASNHTCCGKLVTGISLSDHMGSCPKLPYTMSSHRENSSTAYIANVDGFVCEE
jgi:hypothetical protein